MSFMNDFKRFLFYFFSFFWETKTEHTQFCRFRVLFSNGPKLIIRNGVDSFAVAVAVAFLCFFLAALLSSDKSKPIL